MASMIPAGDRNRAQLMRSEARARLKYLLPNDTILCMPTTPFPAPLRGRALPELDVYRDRINCLTAHGGLTGHPQVSLPGATTAEGFPVGLSIVGPRDSDMTLIAVAQAMEASQ